jgi:hypothetical protein
MDDTLRQYLDDEGRVTHWPVERQSHHRRHILVYLASQFALGALYHAREVDEILKRYHTFGEGALLRQELFERGYMDRSKDGAQYWRTQHSIRIDDRSHSEDD